MHDCIISNHVKKDKSWYHPTAKDVGIIKKIIESSSIEGSLVLDPFMGSGTTAVACKYLKRKYIGFELSKEFCDIAEKRLSKTNIKFTLEDF